MLGPIVQPHGRYCLKKEEVEHENQNSVITKLLPGLISGAELASLVSARLKM
jgi:hypothetical protein